MRSLLAGLFLALLPAAALAQGAPRSIEDCERIKVDLAYNQCLANFGPKVGERPARGGPVAEDYEENAKPAVRSRRGRAAAYQRGRRGRRAASFDVVSGRKGAQVRSYSGSSRQGYRKRRRR
ncbi:MAG TPA: hypothetical protein VEA41_11625 [Salinarimonas sp.]|jgi:hypothetical protein|nr:hypothetical protein [Salinarimonas sp.]